MTIERKCGRCGSAILASHAGRKYCSQECYRAVARKAVQRSNELRYAPPKPLAKTTALTVGQTVRVPTSEVKTIGGKRVTVTGLHIGTIRKITGDVVLVSVGKRKTCEFTAQQIRDAIGRVTEWHAKFGEAMPIGGQE